MCDKLSEDHPIMRAARKTQSGERVVQEAPTLTKPRIYAASRASVPERPAMWRKWRDAGHAIVSTWIDEAGEGQTADLGELWQRIQAEISSADRLVLYVEESDFPLKGALVEVGMALGMGKEVWIVSPGVELEPRSLRPIGSWAKHPRVHFCTDMHDALRCSNFELTQATLRDSESGPSCTVCGTAMAFKCPKCGSTPEPTVLREAATLTIPSLEELEREGDDWKTALSDSGVLREAAMPTLLDMISVWLVTESGPTRMKISIPELKVRVSFHGSRKIILERTFPKAPKETK